MKRRSTRGVALAAVGLCGWLGLGCDGTPAGAPDASTDTRIVPGDAPSEDTRSDAPTAPIDTGSLGPDAPSIDARASGPTVRSTLTLTCDGELQGRAIVNFNTNLGIAFTDPELPFSSRGSISFDFPDGFSGPIENPERYTPDRDRYTLAITDRSFRTFGNHCWPVGSPDQSGSGTLSVWRPNEGIVRASFSNFPLRDCVSMASTCVLNGEIETPGEGVFE